MNIEGNKGPGAMLGFIELFKDSRAFGFLYTTNKIMRITCQHDDSCTGRWLCEGGKKKHDK
jgi:hypothetical protein